MSSSRDDCAIHFFKKIEEDTLRNGDLRIPRSFVDKYWKDISNPLFLVLPKGGRWKVEWKKVGIDIWLINEWKKFVEFYSLDQDNLLMFKYLGRSRFEVVILDQSGLEIVYPLMQVNLDNGNCSYHSKRTDSSLPASLFSQDVQNVGARSERNKVELNELHANDIHETKLQTKGIKRKTSAVKSSNSKKRAIPTGSDTAMQRDQSLGSENPFFFRQMHPSYIEKKFMMIPGSMITEEEEMKHASVTLWTSEERCWLVHFQRNNASGQINLTTGWIHFAEDHDLQLGDLCVFEKIEKTGISFRVFISKTPEEESNSHDGTPRCKDMVSENHISICCIKPEQLYVMNIPRIFLKNHGIANSSEVTLQLGRGSWNVKLDSYGRFTRGWYDFAKECGLKVGDVCELELIDKKKVLFKVSIVASIE